MNTLVITDKPANHVKAVLRSHEGYVAGSRLWAKAQGQRQRLHKLKTHLLEGLVSEQLLVKKMARAAQKKKNKKTLEDMQ